jgi:hypothetical protein
MNTQFQSLKKINLTYLLITEILEAYKKSSLCSYYWLNNDSLCIKANLVEARIGNKRKAQKNLGGEKYCMFIHSFAY